MRHASSLAPLFGLLVLFSSCRDQARGAATPASAAGVESAAAATESPVEAPAELSSRSLPPYAARASEPIDPQVLHDLLPPVNGGWERSSSSARLVESPLGTFAHAQAEYTSPEFPGPLLAVQISDGRGVAEFYSTFELKWKTEVDNRAVTYSRIRIAGQPAVMIESKPNVHTSISVLVAGRYQVDIECEVVPPAELLRFLDVIELSKLAGPG